MHTTRLCRTIYIESIENGVIDKTLMWWFGYPKFPNSLKFNPFDPILFHCSNGGTKSMTIMEGVTHSHYGLLKAV